MFDVPQQVHQAPPSEEQLQQRKENGVGGGTEHDIILGEKNGGARQGVSHRGDEVLLRADEGEEDQEGREKEEGGGWRGRIAPNGRGFAEMSYRYGETQHFFLFSSFLFFSSQHHWCSSLGALLYAHGVQIGCDAEA